ncbi:MAG TPA: FixH family protein [Thiobacillaceae bacterium]|nr:FixH family protein [Thiobacillaceae bacterium]HNA82493.1 FixH family protein [Thiobacillaceae bacterium]HNF89216.1 FixH family protein [Thiobacillaceae bacterium]HNH89895.1 FixH family protein [Thiobacillaceae bacterium]HNI08438.1 FixH family protein [Thiobacillaceae bacterium]
MNLLISIFGGMLLTVLLYAAARKLKLSNFWASVTAAGLPTAAYMAYSVAVWPGLDVVTLHVIAYPTVALLLYQLYGSRAESQGGTHWAPKLMVGFFVVITVLYGGFVYVAGQGLPPALASLLLPGAAHKNIHTGFAGVVAHGEEAAKEYAHEEPWEDKLLRLGWRLSVEGLDALGTTGKGQVQVRVAGSDGKGVEGIAIKLSLARPGQPTSLVLPMTGASGGQYRFSAELPAGGQWMATLELATGNDRVVLERHIGGS